MLKNKLILILFILGISACSSAIDIIAQMDNSQKSHNENQKRNILIFMDFKDIYPKKELRALASAAARGNVKKIRELINNGMNVNSQGVAKATALFWAIHKGNLTGFEELLKLGADPNIQFDDTGNVMHWAAEHQDSRFLKLALAYGGDPNLPGSMFDTSPIFQTIKWNSEKIPETFYLLINSGADLDFKDSKGQTLISTCAALARYDVVFYLLNLGVNYDIKLVTRLGEVNPIFSALERDDKVLNKKSFFYFHKKEVESWFEKRGINYKKVRY